MEIKDELKLLANLIKENGYTLYIVGGYVRDSILGLKNDDIDITSNMPYTDIEALCVKNGYTCKVINKTLGTLQIIKNGLKLEYTQFRKESYASPAKHSPDNVEFVDDINIDVSRRDLSINSIYYDILADKYIDIVGGINDTLKGVIRTTSAPHITLKDDGLRVLRAIRFASTLNFKIERHTSLALHKFKANLKAISKERILKELSLIATADLIYNRPNKKGLELINKYGLLPYIFNSRLKGVEKFKKDEIKTYYTLPKEARLIALYVLVLKKYLKDYSKDEQLMFACNMLLGLDGIKESKGNIATTEKIYRIYQNITYGKGTLTASINYLTLSNTERSIVDINLNKNAKVALSDNISAIKRNHLPLSVHELPIKPDDLIEAGIENKYISKILSSLYNQVLSMTVKNSKEELLKRAKEINETFIKLSKDINKNDTKK